MDRVLLREAVWQLEASVSQASFSGHEQARSQFNALLQKAKDLYPGRVDIEAVKAYDISYETLDELKDAVRRLRSALDLRPAGSSAEVVTQIQLPEDAPSDLTLDIRELEGAIGLGLTKTVLLLAGQSRRRSCWRGTRIRQPGVRDCASWLAKRVTKSCLAEIRYGISKRWLIIVTSFTPEQRCETRLFGMRHGSTPPLPLLSSFAVNWKTPKLAMLRVGLPEG